MAAVIIELADAIVDVLNTAVRPVPISLPFTAERGYVVTYASQAEEGEDELAELRVSVVPLELTMKPESRCTDQFLYTIDVSIFKRLAALTNANADPYSLLAQEIMDLFRDPATQAQLPARLVSAENPPIFDAELLRTKNLFGTVVRLILRKDRDK